MATRIKRYEAPLADLDALLARIEAEMGPTAELETREFKRHQFLGMFGGQRMVEVIAVLEISNEDAAFKRAQPAASAVQQSPAPDAVAPAEQPRTETASPVEPVPEYGLPPAGKTHKVDISADAPVQVAPESPASAVGRITADAQRVAAAASAAQHKSETQPTPPATPQEIKPAITDTIQSSEPSHEREAPVVANSAELSELRESINELKDTIQLLVTHQQQSQPEAVTAAAQAEPKSKTQTAEPATEAPPEASAQSDAVLDLLANASGEQLAGAMDLASLASHVADPVSLDHGASLPAVERQVYDRLLDWNIGSYDALELINKALEEAGAKEPPSEKSLLSLIFREICRNILLSGGIKLGTTPPGKAVALIGATGVGKTTTIAKLAAVHAFQLGKRVSLVSLDNYRIAAAEQLRTYAEIMGIDIDIVFGRDEFDQVLTQRRGGDLVLIDTAGRSPANANQIYQLREVFSAHPPDEVHLVVSASTKADDLRMLLENFAPLSYDHVIVSKLDETRSLGCLYNLVKNCPLPISYFTVGQSVPEDIRTASLTFVRTWIEQGRIS